MINVSEQIQEYYKADSKPGPITVIIGNKTYGAGDRPMGSMTITESLCSGDMLDFSAVEKSSAEFSVFNFNQTISDIQGKPVEIYQTVLGERIPLGIYTVAKAENDGEHIMKITAYDNLVKFDRDVSVWWNEMVTFPISAKALLISLCGFCGVRYDLPESYCNSTYFVTKTISVEDTTGAEFLGYLQELCGCFFRCDRNGVLRRIGFDGQGLVPHVGLYPREGLYPASSYAGKLTNPNETYNYQNIVSDLVVADYDVKKIDKLQVRGTDDDIGVISGTGTNTYVIQANPLLYSLDSSQASSSVVDAIYQSIKNITYRPFSAKVKALPYVECGDMVKVVSYRGIEAVSPLLSRTMSGGSLIFDEFECNGRETRVIQTAVNKQIKVLNQRTLEIRADVEEFSTTLTEIRDETTTMQTKIQQNSDNITLESSRSSLNNLLVNSNFSNSESATKYWTLFPTATMTAQIVDDNLFGTGKPKPLAHGKALALVSTASGNSGIWQKVNVDNYITHPLHVGLIYRVKTYDGSANMFIWVTVYGENNTYLGGRNGMTINKGGELKSNVVKFDLASIANGKKVAYIGIYFYIQNATGRNEVEINNFFATFSDIDVLPYWTWNDYSKADVVSQINLSPDGVLIKGEKIDIQGITTFSSDSGETTVIDGGTLKGQTIESVTMKTSTLNSGTINSTTINSSSINSTDITGGTINGTTIKGGQFQAITGSNVAAKMYGKNLGGSYGGYGFCIDGTGGLALDCSHILIAPTVDLFVKKPDGNFSRGLQGDVTFKNWDGFLYKLTFTHGIAWYYASTAWSNHGGYNGTIGNYKYRNGILMSYNGSEGLGRALRDDEL